jgi:hypothetical protein
MSVLTSYEDWRQFFGVNNFNEFLIDDLHFGPAFKDFTKAAIGDRHTTEVAVKNFSAEAFKSTWKVAQSSSIRDAQHINRSVFWGTGGAVTKIPGILQSTFTHCPMNHNPGSIDKCLVDIMNMAKQMYK